MNKPSSLGSESADQTAKTGTSGKAKWLIVIAIVGVAAVIVIARLAYFAWPAASPVTKLEVKDMVVGTGREAKTGDTVMVEYIGWVYGKDRKDFFDRSANHERPFEFVLGKGQAVEGFDKGLLGMKAGGQRELIIPPDMAYGNKGALNGKIPPNAALRFEVELLEVSTTLPPTQVKRLKVEDLVVGTGAIAEPGKTLTVHYTGWLEDGTRFDSSHDSGKPIEFVLGKGKVIAGWEQGLVGMKAGGKRKLTIPPDLGYGQKGAFNYVPHNAALIFEVELLAVK
jgi:peptidylprolyl isomerase